MPGETCSQFSNIDNSSFLCSLAAMASSKAKLLVLGVKDFYAFKELDQLPADMEILGIGTVDELLGTANWSSVIWIPTLPRRRKEWSKLWNFISSCRRKRSLSLRAESVGDRLEEVDVLLNTDYGSTSGGKKSINQKDSLTKLWPKLPNLKWVHVGSAGLGFLPLLRFHSTTGLIISMA